MLHPHTVVRYINDTVGYGVFTTQHIPMGTITWVRDALDREYTPEQMQALPEQLSEAALTYAYRNRKGNYVLPWDNTRFTNHSFYANSMITPYGFEIALRDIDKGEQLTNDYGTLNIIEPFQPVDEGHERKWVHPDDLLRLSDIWDLSLLNAYKLITNVNQPLRDFFEGNHWIEVENLPQLNEYRSIRECCFVG